MLICLVSLACKPGFYLVGSSCSANAPCQNDLGCAKTSGFCATPGLRSIYYDLPLVSSLDVIVSGMRTLEDVALLLQQVSPVASAVSPNPFAFPGSGTFFSSSSVVAPGFPASSAGLAVYLGNFVALSNASYQFTLGAQDAASFFLDGILLALVKSRAGGPFETATAWVRLSAGLHSIVVVYVNYYGQANGLYLKLNSTFVPSNLLLSPGSGFCACMPAFELCLSVWCQRARPLTPTDIPAAVKAARRLDALVPVSSSSKLMSL